MVFLHRIAVVPPKSGWWASLTPPYARTDCHTWFIRARDTERCQLDAHIDITWLIHSLDESRVHAVRMVRHRRATKLSSWTVEDIDGVDVGSLAAAPSRLGAMDL